MFPGLYEAGIPESILTMTGIHTKSEPFLMNLKREQFLKGGWIKIRIFSDHLT